MSRTITVKTQFVQAVPASNEVKMSVMVTATTNMVKEIFVMRSFPPSVFAKTSVSKFCHVAYIDECDTLPITVTDVTKTSDYRTYLFTKYYKNIEDAITGKTTILNDIRNLLISAENLGYGTSVSEVLNSTLDGQFFVVGVDGITSLYTTTTVVENTVNSDGGITQTGTDPVITYKGASVCP